MLTVWKFDVPLQDWFTLTMPVGAKVLTVQTQHEAAQLWALVEAGARLEERQFRLAGTGHPMNEPGKRLEYVATFQVAGGSLVFHVFEVKE